MRSLLCNTLLALLLAGCATPDSNARNAASEVHLLRLPVTVNLDGLPGPDGFAIRLFVTQPNSTKGAPIKKGALEILMYDGVISTDNLLATPPAQTWKYTGRDLDRA